MSATATAEVATAGVTFNITRTGARTSPPVLWLHGSGPGATALSNWEGVITDLADDFHNVAPDIVGFGDSSHPDPPPDGLAAFTELRVTTLLGLLDELGLDRVHLVGNSMGGMIALTLAMRAPERVDRIVLMGSAGAPIPPTADLLRLITFYDNPTTSTMTELLQSFVHDPALFGADLQRVAEARLPRALRDDIRRSHVATFSGGPVLFTPEQLSEVSVPVLVLHGRGDRIIPVEAALHFAWHLPDAQLHVLPNTGHWLQIEQRTRFTTLVRAFLRGDI